MKLEAPTFHYTEVGNGDVMLTIVKSNFSSEIWKKWTFSPGEPVRWSDFIEILEALGASFQGKN
jgi:hypothetical protein